MISKRPFILRIRRFTEVIYHTICQITHTQWIICVLALILVGQLVNFWFPLRFFHVYQFLFLFAIIYSSFQIKWFFFDFKDFRKENASQPELHFLNEYLLKTVYSPMVLMLVILITFFYTFAALWLEFIEINVAGIYSAIIIIAVVALAVLAHALYSCYLLYLNKLSLNEELQYNYYYPSKTIWLIKIAAIGRRFSNGFFILGFIYTLVFFLNSKGTLLMTDQQDIVRDLTGFQLFFESNIVFSICWFMIFVIIIFAFPFYHLKQRKLLSSIIEQMKIKTIQTLTNSAELAKRSGDLSFENEIKFFDIIEKIDNSPRYPIKNNITIPVLSTLLSMCIHLLKISESIV